MNKHERTSTQNCGAALRVAIVTLAALAVVTPAPAAPLGTEFSYQGELRDAGIPADGDYDFIFRLFDADAGGSQVGSDVPVDDWLVIGGLFTVELDFGASAFAGDARWLEIAVRPGASGDPHTVLSPRQPLTAAPYALFALNGSAGGGYWTLNGSGIYNNNAGYVGIGTSTPVSLLHLSSLSDIELTLDADTDNVTETDNPRIVFKQDGQQVVGRVGYRDGTNGFEIMQEFANSLILGTSNTDRVTITHDGFVGVNRSTQVSGVEFFGIQAPVDSGYGGMYIRTDGEAGWPFYGYKAGDLGDTAWHYLDGETDDWHLYNDGNRLTVTDGGFVGVNRETPVTGADYFSVQAPVDADQYGGMYIVTDSSSAWPFYGYRAGANSMWTYYDGGTQDWHLYNDGVRLTVTDSGNVGIGDTTPTAHLEVNSEGLDNNLYGIRAVGSGWVGRIAAENTSPADVDDTTIGVLASSTEGVYGSYDDETDSAIGALGYTPGSGAAVYGYACCGSYPLAGYFVGDVQITGNLSKGGGSFKIDHPLDPENKYLYHSFVESPDMMNIYNGVATTDERGYARITMPEWFEALNRDFRYQLTVIDDRDGDDWVMAKVVSEIAGNQFRIRTSRGNTRVSWQVTGVRQDAFANANRVPVEEDKSAEERGKYLHPAAFGQPHELQIGRAESREESRESE